MGAAAANDVVPEISFGAPAVNDVVPELSFGAPAVNDVVPELTVSEFKLLRTIFEGRLVGEN